MSSAIFVYWVVLALCLVQAAAFFALYHFDRVNRPAVSFGLAFAAAGFSFGGEIVLATGFAPSATRMVIAVAMVAMFIFVADGLARRYRVGLSRGGGLAIGAASALLYLMILDLPRADFTRQMLYQLPYGLLSLLALSIIWRARDKVRADWLVMLLFALMAVHFPAKPFVALWTGGVGAEPSGFAATSYAALSAVSGAVLIVTLAMVALGMMLSDSAARIIRNSERDAQTGVLTRAGFAHHAARHLAGAAPNLADPAAGDLALILLAMDLSGRPHALPVVALAECLGAGAPRDALVGRMAEHDFAVLVPGANLFAARALADSFRAAAAEDPALGAVTLSIGITEREPGDVYAEMLARALWALSQAQRSGGDTIRLAARSGFGLAAGTK
ncbi:GGDEF domain-containing protein [Pelagibacterium lacus]|uniref:GGDEF domain-containing protein n=1 Tax=Pelagibacterium lacus TaxID=2282655 RepID=A0A369W513_9HYPH|nr:GGDEF domain-containing protein [Pelagibacterium lacus]RDE09658.1 GGDEF domain-containing protein [Pelagibacterium lacus]